MPNIGSGNSSPGASPRPPDPGCRSNRRRCDMRITSAYKFGLLISIGSAACTTTKVAPASDAHADHAAPSASTAVADTNSAIPADAAGAQARLTASPRHGEWAMIRTGDGDSLKAWVV